MPLTRDFRVTTRERLERGPGFREALLEEGVQCLLAGEVDVGKSVLRDYVNATIGFQELGGLTARVCTSKYRRFGDEQRPMTRGADRSWAPAAQPQLSHHHSRVKGAMSSAARSNIH